MTRNRARCARLWQAEAIEDERLSPADQASFERHVDTCRECAAERAELLRLREIAARLPAHGTTPFRRRFLHNELLRRANERALSTRSPFDRRGLIVAFAVAVCVAAASFFIVFRAGLERPPPLAMPADEPRYRVVATEGGRFYPVERGPALRLALSAGSFDISVHKLHAAQRFLVNLPDGELEVRGTRFRVEVDSKTRRVSVSEGLVALRLHGQPELPLGPGDSWPRVAPALLPMPSGAPSALPPAPTASVRPGPRPHAARGRTPLAAASVSPAPELAQAPSAAGEFATAMAAFSRGDFAAAEQLLLAFESHHPQNAHVEDTLFLRALCRVHRGDPSGAQALARAYLRRYPTGFHAEEAERMAREEGH